MNDLLDQLRTKTRNEHERLQSEVDLVSSTLTLSDYRTWLERFWGIYVPLEARIAAATRNLGDANFFWGRRKVPLLSRDLDILGHDETSRSLLPLATRLPLLKSVAGVYGALYVVEGATLGGQIITRAIRSRHLVAENGDGCRFFAGYGENTRNMWKEFCDRLLQITDERAQQRVVEAAQATFRALRIWLCKQEAGI